MKSLFTSVLITASLGTISPALCSAQDHVFGVGARFTMVRGDAAADTSAERFTGGQIRAMVSKRTGIEVSLDSRTQSNEALTERVRDLPLQASLLLFPIRSTLSPYVLGGVGWYSHRVQQLSDQQVISSETTRRIGSPAGFVARVRA